MQWSRCMKVLSFMRLGSDLAPVEVELSLSPGLPQFHFLGLPDAALKESALRIRSALREQGFELPQSHQILVHLKPTHLRKTSRGLDLAVAAALLWETGQLTPPEEGERPVVYGELTLKGEVVCPEDAVDLPCPRGVSVLTGVTKPLSFRTLQARELKDLREPVATEPELELEHWLRPSPTVASFPQSAARVAAVVAAGEHSALMAGPPGSGKSTLAECVPSWIEGPQIEEARHVRRLWRQAGLDLRWRPVLRPHSSITPLAMIGGGTALWAGEISRAHGGVLIMDELLEFHADIQESLREPVENGSISLVRGGRSRSYPASLLLLATTNLCACGRFVPRRGSMACRCPKAARRRTLTRLSGPFVDRFAVFILTDEWSAKEEAVSVDVIHRRVERAIEFRQRARAQWVPNAKLDSDSIEASLSDFQRAELLTPASRSRRRRASLLRVARTLADLEERERIENRDLDEAVHLSVRSHRLLEEWNDG